MNEFVREIIDLLEKRTGLPEKEIEESIEVPPDQSLGDYAFPCFVLAKKLKKSPQEIASELASELKSQDLIEKITSSGPYLNFEVRKDKLAELVLKKINKEKDSYGSDKTGKGKTIVIDFSSPNIAKPFGIGHLRSTVIGNTLYKIFNKLGFKVIRVNHLGDWGTQFGKLIVAYKRWGDEQEISSDPIASLFNLYVRFHDEAEKDKTLEDEAREHFRKLEKGDKEATSLWKRFKKYSMDEFERIYKMLDISFDYYAGESFYNELIDQTVGKIQKSGLAEISQNALVIKLDKYNLPLCLIRKKDEATLYATRDITAAIYRYDTYKFFKNIYVVGTAQKLHFQQVFKVLELMGYEWAKDMVHVDFGWVKFKQEMMSTRKGNIVLLEDVLNKSIELALKIIEEKNPGLENKKEVAYQVGIGAVIFADLSVRRNKDIDFDWDKALSFEGETGPYLQYTHARLCSLVSKYGKSVNDKVEYSTFQSTEEIALIKLLDSFPQRIKQAADTYEPYLISSYLIELCSLFNRFYQKERVITEDEQKTKTKMFLVSGILVVLALGLDLLGIKAPERM
ncbi:MAG: arginine--tRNA ligase [candidate division Zixibacteria bacterium]|nr:arginine--tRNA ligase [candidate division Zixibacteria bacterium]